MSTACVVTCTVQFVVVYLGLWIGQGCKNFLTMELPRVFQLTENPKATIGLCPMLAFLFVGACMRALPITDNRSALQGCVQVDMHMTTSAVLTQFLTCLLAGYATTGKVERGEDGTPK